jgi:hypothetical protein
MALAWIGIVIGLAGLYLGVVALKAWYRENATPGGVTAATNVKLMGGFFIATVGLLGGGLPLLLR